MSPFLGRELEELEASVESKSTVGLELTEQLDSIGVDGKANSSSLPSTSNNSASMPRASYKAETCCMKMSRVWLI